MKKISDLIDSLDSDLAWRKKEVTALVLTCESENIDVLIKSCILLIYSHWEGYVKNACKCYLQYVSNKKIKLSELTHNFSAISLKGMIQEISRSKETLTLSNEMKLLDTIDNRENKVFRIDKKVSSDDKDKTIINTTDNLSYKVFSSFLDIVGIGQKIAIATKAGFIDQKLLENRNKIAHGSKIDMNDSFDMDIESIKETKNLIFAILSSLSDDLKIYAEEEYFKRDNADMKEVYNKKSNDIIKRELEDIIT